MTTLDRVLGVLVGGLVAAPCALAGEFAVVSTISQTRGVAGDASRGVAGAGLGNYVWVRGVAEPVLLQGTSNTVITFASAMSADGLTVCGHSNFRPAYWRDFGAPAQPLSLVSGATVFATGEANGLSGDGSVCVGRANVTGLASAVVWTLPSGAVARVVPLLAGRTNAQLVGVSGDGAVMVGNAWSGVETNLAFVVRGAGPELLPPLSGDAQSTVVCMSRDGRFGAGISRRAPAVDRAVVWDLVTHGATEIAGSGVVPQALSADGSVLVGSLSGAPTVWLRGDGRVLELNALCDSLGISRDGWTVLGEPLRVSDDGRSIVGRAERAGAFASCVLSLECYDSITLTLQPSGAVSCPSGAVTMSVGASGAGPYTYVWRRDGAPIDAGANPSAATATLELTGLAGSDTGVYTCRVSNACGSVTSNGAQLTVCRADITCDGSVDGDDVISFFGFWDQSDVRADVTEDEAVDGDDVIEFFARWDTNC